MRVWAREREITSEPWWCATNDAMAGATAAAAEGRLEEGDDGVRLKRKGGEAWREQGLQFRFFFGGNEIPF